MSESPNLWHLHILQTVAGKRSMTAAAEAARLTQPAVSQAIKSLSDHYGVELLARAGAKVEPTPEARILLDRASAALALFAEALKEAAGNKGIETAIMLRGMSARRLEALIGVVRHGSFALAAKSLGLSAPTVHRAAKDLEQALGATLFEQTSFGVKPTRRAELLATRASLGFAELEQARAELLAARGEEAGRTVIGAMPLARSHLVPAVVAEFSARHSGHRISIVEGAYEDLLMQLQRGEADFLVGALRLNLPEKDVIEEPLFEDHLSIVMRAGHPASATPGITARTLTAYPWIAPRATSPLRGQFDSLFKAVGADLPTDVIECNSLGASRVLLINSDRLMLLSDMQIEFEKAAGMLISRPHPKGAVTRRIGLTTRRNWRPTKTQAALVSLLKEHASGIGRAR